MKIRQKAKELGFDYCRIVPIGTAAHADFFEAWIELGHAGEMAYLARNQEKRRNPVLLAEPGKPAFCSMIILGVNHYQFDLPAALRDDPSRGIIASYAWGDDYHEVIRPQLYQLDAFVCAQSGRQSRGKSLVDTGPVLERDWAQRAGLGFTGKNCCTIHPIDGSWLLLATLLVPEQLPYDDGSTPPEPSLRAGAVAQGLSPAEQYGSWQIPITTLDTGTDIDQPAIGTCGRCRRCIEACPTNAFVGPFHLNPQRCISYWTIESKQPIPRELRPLFGNRIFGCDICQEVCPWNKRLEARAPLLTSLHAKKERIAPTLLAGFDSEHPYWLDRDAFNRQFRRSPIKRAKRHGMLRNVCVALGNWADPVAIEPLSIALNDPEPLARGHAAWALGQVFQSHKTPQIVSILHKRRVLEMDQWVMEEIDLALPDLN